MILLDTHTWIWWVHDPEKLSAKAQEAINTAISDKGFYISSFSTWEISMLVSKGKLIFDREIADWVAKTEVLPFVEFVPVNNRIALKSIELDLHADPADRIIAATALSLGAAIVTKDKKLRDYKTLKTIW